MEPDHSEPQVTIRRATPTDLDALVELNREFCHAEGYSPNIAVVRTAFAPLVVDDRFGKVWIVDVSDMPDRPEGYGVITWGYSIEAGGVESIFDELYVRRQKQGFGTQAMALMLAAVRDFGVARIYLETERPNAQARRLYERLGFVEEDSIWMSLDFRDGTNQQ